MGDVIHEFHLGLSAGAVGFRPKGCDLDGFEGVFSDVLGDAFALVFKGNGPKTLAHGQGFELGLANSGFDLVWLGWRGEVEVGVRDLQEVISDRSTDKVELDAQEILEMRDDVFDGLHEACWSRG